jgi:hypothetical protein
MPKSLIFLIVIALNTVCTFSSYAIKKELTKYQIVESATKALNKDGFDLYRVEIIYDQNNKMWRERVNRMTDLQSSPDFKLFEQGFMKNYQAVLFNFKDPSGEVWVFVDRDNGEVLEIYRPPFTVNKSK